MVVWSKDGSCEVRMIVWSHVARGHTVPSCNMTSHSHPYWWQDQFGTISIWLPLLPVLLWCEMWPCWGNSCSQPVHPSIHLMKFLLVLYVAHTLNVIVPISPLSQAQFEFALTALVEETQQMLDAARRLAPHWNLFSFLLLFLIYIHVFSALISRFLQHKHEYNYFKVYIIIVSAAAGHSYYL